MRKHILMAIVLLISFTGCATHTMPQQPLSKDEARHAMLTCFAYQTKLLDDFKRNPLSLSSAVMGQCQSQVEAFKETFARAIDDPVQREAFMVDVRTNVIVQNTALSMIMEWRNSQDEIPDVQRRPKDIKHQI